jgi:hypothetical protein
MYERLEIHNIQSEPRYWMDMKVWFTPRHVIPRIGPSLQSVQKSTPVLGLSSHYHSRDIDLETSAQPMCSIHLHYKSVLEQLYYSLWRLKSFYSDSWEDQIFVFWVMAPFTLIEGRLSLKCDGTRAGTRFRLSAKRTSLFKSAGGVSSVDYWQPSCAHQR